MAASLFVSHEEARVAEGISILNELIIPCMHLMNGLDISREDLDALEAMRSRWCSYLGREDMDGRSGLGRAASPPGGTGIAGRFTTTPKSLEILLRHVGVILAVRAGTWLNHPAIAEFNLLLH